MPGRRNLQRERSQHDATARHLAIYTQLRTAVPEYDRALIGQRAILDHLHGLGIRRLRGTQLSWRIVNRWRRHGCPILRGNVSRRRSGPALTTCHALTAWLLSRFHTCDLFVVAPTRELTPTGFLPRVAQRTAA